MRLQKITSGIEWGRMHHPHHRKKRRAGAWIALLILLGVGAGFVLAARGGKKSGPYEVITLEKGDLVQSVSVTGRVVPEERVELGFEETGRITRIGRKVGEKAFRGEALAELDASKIMAELAEAEAAAKAEKVKLEELRRGARIEDIEVKKAELAKTEQDLSNAYGKVLQTLEDAYAKGDDAVRVKTLGIFSGGQSAGYWFTVSTCDSQSKARSGELRGVSETTLRDWRATLTGMTGSVSEEYRPFLEEEVKKSGARLGTLRLFLETTAWAINADCLSGETSLESYRKNINTGRDAIITAIAGVEAVEQDIASAKRALETKTRELELKQAGASPEELRAAELKVEEADARVAKTQARRNGMILRAPFDGVVTEEKAKEGQIIGANAPVMIFMSQGSPKVEAFVPEADIAKIKPGDGADITLDAYEADDIFPARVVMIDPAETLIEGVATYKITLRFTGEDARVKPGMTADIDIITAVRNSTLAVPQRAVMAEDGAKFVRVLKGEKIERTRVATGIRGSDGLIEVTEGLGEGDKVILFIDDEADHRD